ncbi:MAG: hypothetical protein OXT65_03120 [Alphaproteobacteria bacterium]|nr:hypothetical protein [Alphaproteobacteria bacterium]
MRLFHPHAWEYVKHRLTARRKKTGALKPNGQGQSYDRVLCLAPGYGFLPPLPQANMGHVYMVTDNAPCSFASNITILDPLHDLSHTSTPAFARNVQRNTALSQHIVTTLLGRFRTLAPEWDIELDDYIPVIALRLEDFLHRAFTMVAFMADEISSGTYDAILLPEPDNPMIAGLAPLIQKHFKPADIYATSTLAPHDTKTPKPAPQRLLEWKAQRLLANIKSRAADYPAFDTKGLIYSAKMDANYAAAAKNLYKAAEKHGSATLWRDDNDASFGSEGTPLPAARPAWRFFTPYAPLFCDLLDATLRENGVHEMAGKNAPYIWPALLPQISLFMCGFMPADLATIYHLEKNMAQQRPDFILTTTGRKPTARILTIAARRHHVPTFDAQVLFASERPRYRPPVADHAFVIDSHARHLYIQHFGMKPDHVHMAGLIRMDSTAPTTKAKDPFQNKTHRVLCALQPVGADNSTRMIEALINVCRDLNDTMLVLKPHPREKHLIPTYAAIIDTQGAGHFCTVTDRDDTPALIAASQVVVTAFSNVGMEAALQNRAVISLNLGGGESPWRIDKMGLATLAETEEELEAKLHALLTDPATQKQAAEKRATYLRENPHLQKGSAAERVMDFIYESQNEKMKTA